MDADQAVKLYHLMLWDKCGSSLLNKLLKPKRKIFF